MRIGQKAMLLLDVFCAFFRCFFMSNKTGLKIFSYYRYILYKNVFNHKPSSSALESFITLKILTKYFEFNIAITKTTLIYKSGVVIWIVNDENFV